MRLISAERILLLATAAVSLGWGQVGGTGTPSITSISPTSVPAGSNDTTLTVQGENFFASGATANVVPPTVSLTGTPVATTFVNTGTLTALVLSGMLNSPKQYSVQVTNPDGKASGTVTFSVLAPLITSLSTASLPAGSPAFQLTVTGSNYLSGSQVSFRGTTLATDLVNGVLITTVPANLLTSPGQAVVQVINPGGAPSNSVLFTVAAPVLNSISPNALPVGSGDFSLTASGGFFISGSQILFNGTALNTTFVNINFVRATVPGSLIASAGQFDVKVRNPGGATTLDQIFTVQAPVISSISPASVLAGAATFTLTVNGVNFVAGSQVLFDGTALATTTSDGPSPLLATVPASLVAGPKVVSIVVANPGVSGNLSAGFPFTVIGTLAIVTTSLPPGTTSSFYSATLTGKGGTLPYTWTASGIPPGLGLDPATGVLSGTFLAGGTYLVSVVLQDAAKSTVTAQFPLVVGPPPLSFAPSSLPVGMVEVSYFGTVGASGGSGSYMFSLAGGSLPDGLALSSNGSISGTPKTPGQFGFTVVVTDSAGASASKGFGITIQPAQLNLTGGPTGPVPTGTPISITFTGTGGVPPYIYTACSAMPPGTTFSNGVVSGTPTTAGTYNICVTVTDKAGTSVTKNSPLTVTEGTPPPTPLTLGGSVGDGKVGDKYSGQLTASGGTGPYTYSVSGLPDGLSLSASGAISGTPSTAGQFTLSATVTDAKGATANASFPITIAPAGLTIVTASLPDGVVDVDYLAKLQATGGFPPYTWTVSGLPDGVSATPEGVISGKPKTAGTFSVNATVKDSAPGSKAASHSYNVTVLNPLVITTTSLPNGTVGTAYKTTSIVTSGGTPPLAFSATGLPAGLTMSAAGTISGTPTAPTLSPANIVVTVKDAGGAIASKSYPVTIVLPPTPPLIFSGIPATANPLQQPRLQISLGNTFPVDIVVTLTLTFAPDSGPDDPTIQFSTGGRITRITVPAGSLNGTTDVGVQTGSVAGLITIVAQMQASGQDITPSPAPRTTIRIAPAAPVIVTGSLTAVRNSTGFTVTLNGYVTDREMTQAIFTFTAASGSNLQTTSLTVAIDTLFAQYFSSAGAVATGSQFTFTQPFTVTGSNQAIVSVTVTLVNKIGQSAPATATLN